MRVSVASIAALATCASAAAVPSNSTSCASGLYLIVARGTTEDPGAGISEPLATKITDEIKGSKFVALDYPATLFDPDYKISVFEGIKAMHTAIEGYAKTCPQSKIAIIGYSQGAQLTMDTLCGSASGDFGNITRVSPQSVKDNIAAVVLFGDPSHVANTTYDKGTSIKNGIFKRNNTSVQVCEGYSDRLVSYCDTGDNYCDAGNNRSVHVSYIYNYSDEARKFVVDQYNKAPSGSSKSNSTATSPSATASTLVAPSASSTSGSDSAPSSSPTSTAGANGRSSASSLLVAGNGAYLAFSLAVVTALQLL